MKFLLNNVIQTSFIKAIPKFEFYKKLFDLDKLKILMNICDCKNVLKIKIKVVKLLKKLLEN